MEGRKLRNSLVSLGLSEREGSIISNYLIMIFLNFLYYQYISLVSISILCFLYIMLSCLFSILLLLSRLCIFACFSDVSPTSFSTSVEASELQYWREKR